jgi:hypothetical protein
MFACWTDAAAEAIEALVRMRRHKPPLTDLSCGADHFSVEVEPLDLPEDGAKLDIVGTVSGDFGVEPPVVELQDRLLHSGE